jgi:hypothetical protein
MAHVIREVTYCSMATAMPLGHVEEVTTCMFMIEQMHNAS